MTELFVRLFIKDSSNISDPIVRGRYGALSGGVGIFLNVCMFAAKLAAGLLTASIAVTADAFNNLSDAGSSLVTLLGFKLAEKPADTEHPFGHGRLEYITGLIISMVIMVVGFELLRESVTKIFVPEDTVFNYFSIIVMAVAVLIKLWMFFFNRGLGKTIGSQALFATAKDSLSDVISTSAVIAGLVIGKLTGVNLDGYLGTVVALFIMYTGFSTAKDSLSPLLGQPPEKEFVEDIKNTVLCHGEIVGIHDLIVNDYGPGRCIISLHAEVPCDANILEMHDIIDNAEHELSQKFKCIAVIHMDPIAVNDEATDTMYKSVLNIAKQVDERLTIHDFRMVEGKTHTNLIFDVVVPYKYEYTDAETAQKIRREISAEHPQCFAVMHIERSYT